MALYVQMEKMKLGIRHSMPAKSITSRPLKRLSSVPGEICPTPPPPPPIPDVEDGDVSGKPDIEILVEPTLRPSDIVKGMCRSMSALSKYLTLSNQVENFKVAPCKKCGSLAVTVVGATNLYKIALVMMDAPKAHIKYS